MDRPELAPGVTAADGPLAHRRRISDANLDPRSDGIAVRTGLPEREIEPVTHRHRPRRVAGPDVPPELDGRPQVQLDQVEEAVAVEVGQRRAATGSKIDDAGLLRALDERPVRLTDEQVARIPGRVLGDLLDVALRDVEVDEAVVVDVLELRVPGGRRPRVAARERHMGEDASLEGDVAIGRLARPGGQGLQLVVALAGEIHLGVAVAGDVLAGDPHAPDLRRHPAVGVGVQARLLAGRHPPELFLAVGAVVVTIVADPQVATAGPVPVAEQHRQGAVAGSQLDRGPVGRAVRTRPDELAGVAVESRLPVGAEPEVVADRQRRQPRPLPGRAERRRLRGSAVEPPRLVRALEAAVATPAQQDVLAGAEDRQVDVAVTVDVERVRPVDAIEVGGWVGHRGEPQGTADGAGVPIERRRRGSTRQVELRPAVTVAVEHGDAAGDRERAAAGECVVEPARRRLADVPGRAERGRRGGPTQQADRSDRPDARQHDDRDRDRQPGGDPPFHEPVTPG
jgi:hypothetical protein